MASISITTTLRGFGKANAQIKGLSVALNRFGVSAIAVGKIATTRLTLPIIALGAGIIATAGKFDKSMNRVAALTGETGTAFDKLRNQAKQLGETTEFSASQAAGAMGFLAQTGFNAEQIFKALPGTLRLASAGQLDLATTADIASNILKAFGKEAEEIAEVSDILAKAFTSTNVDLLQLSEAMKFIAPTAKAVGLSLEEMSAAIGFLGDVGIQGSIAGTSLNQAIIKIIKPSGIAKTVIKQLGLEMRSSSGGVKSLADILGQLEKTGATTTQIMEIFGIRGGRAILSLTGKSKDLREFTKELENAGGTAERIQKIQLRGFAGAIVELKSSLEGLAISIGESGLLQGFVDIARNVTGVIRAMSALPDSVKQIGVAFVTVLGIGGPVLLAIGFFSKAIAALIASTGPFGLLLLAIGAIVFAWANWEAIVDIAKLVFQGVKKWMVDNFKGVVDAIGDLIDNVIGFFQNMWDMITGGSIVPEMMKDIELEFGKLQSIMVDVTEDATSKVEGFFSGMSKSVFENLKQVGQFFTIVQGLLTNLSGSTKETTRVIIDNIGDVGGGFAKAALEVEEAAQRLMAPLGGIFGEFDEIAPVTKSLKNVKAALDDAAESAKTTKSEIKLLGEEEVEERARIEEEKRRLFADTLAFEVEIGKKRLEDVRSNLRFELALSEEGTRRDLDLRRQLANVNEGIAQREIAAILRFTELSEQEKLRIARLNERLGEREVEIILKVGKLTEEQIRKRLELLKEEFQVQGEEGGKAIRTIESELGRLEEKGRKVNLSLQLQFQDLNQTIFRVAEQGRDAFRGFFQDVLVGGLTLAQGLKSLFTSVVNIILSEFARLAADTIFRILFLGQRTTAPLVSSPGTAAGGGGGGGGLLGAAFGLGGLIPGGTTSLAAAAGNLGLLLSGGSAAIGNLFASTILSGSIFPIIGSILQLIQGDISAAIGTAVLGTIGFLIGGPVGGFIGSFLGGFFQTGGSKVVTSPQFIGVGELGRPERITVEPLVGRGGGASGITLIVQGDLITDNFAVSRLAQRLRTEISRENARSV